MMQQMRDNTKWIMLLTAAAFVALMVFEWGMDLSGQSSAALAGGEMGRVNGEAITYEQYSATYQSLYNQRQQASEEPISAAENRQIEESAWNRLVMQHLVRQELARRGIEVTAEEIRRAARYLPPPSFRTNEAFRTDGRFDLQKYHDFLAASAGNRGLMLQLEAYYRDLLPRNKLYQQILAGLHVTDAELWRMWRDRHETATARYIAIDPAAVVPDDSVTVSDADVRAYYDDHQEDYTRPAQATVRLVALDKAPTAADTAAAREHAETVRRQLLDGEPFADVAARESADPGSAQQGGRLTVRRGQTVPAFEQAVWSLPTGRIGEPVRTQFGFHLIRVESRTEEEADVRHILIPIERTDASEIHMLELADSLEALGEALPLDDAAREMGLRVRTAELTRDVPFVPGVGELVEGGDWAFQTAEPGQVSPLYESSMAFYMLELVERRPERVPALEEVEAVVRGLLVERAKRDAAREIGLALVDRIRSGESLEDAAAARGLEVADAGPFTRAGFVPGLGTANAAIGAAFGLRPGGTSGLVEANGRFFIVRTVERTPADRDAWEAQKEAQRARVVQALEQQRIQEFLAGLREEAEIEDRRDEFFAAAESQQQQMPQPGLF